MGKFEIWLVGVMAFLILGILGLIATSPDSMESIEETKTVDSLGSEPETKSSVAISLGDVSKDTTQVAIISESLTVEITESEPEVMEESEPEVMEFSGTVSVPTGSSVPGCEETNECFLPANISISVGDEVTWSNDDSAAHTVTSGLASEGPDGNFDSSLFMAGDTFSVTFDEAGEYPYFCMVHPWMTGNILVN